MSDQHTRAVFAVAQRHGLSPVSSEGPAGYLDRKILALEETARLKSRFINELQNKLQRAEDAVEREKVRILHHLPNFETWQGETIPVWNDEFFRASHVRDAMKNALGIINALDIPDFLRRGKD